MSRVTCHVSHEMRLMSHVTCLMSHVIFHMSYVTCHMSHVSCYMSHVTCHMSHVIFHMSYVTCHMSHVTCHMPLNFSCPEHLYRRRRIYFLHNTIHLNFYKYVERMMFQLENEIIYRSLSSQLDVFLYPVLETTLEFLHVMCFPNVTR